MRDDAGLAERAICAAHGLWDVAALLRQSLDVCLVDDRVFPCDRWPLLVRPAVRGFDNHRLEHGAGIVAPVEGEVGLLGAGAITEMRVGPGEAAAEPLRIGVDQ